MADLPSSFFKFIPSDLKHNISIPSSFWAKLKIGRPSNAILRRGNRQWTVEICDGGVFGDGWRKLVRDNGVEEFDFIVFKHQGKMVFEFLVFDQSSCERPYLKLSHKMDDEEEEAESIHTHGLKKLKRSKKHKRNVDFEFNDTRFQVKMTPSYIKFSTLHEDHLKIGDICMFQLVNYGKVPVFSLSILGRKSISSHKMAMSARNVGSIHCGEDGCPYFLGKLTSSCIKRRHLYIPIKFARKNRLLENGEMIIKNAEDERSWIVEFKNYRKNYPYITHGWEEFRVAYGLKEGDRFKFKIMEKVGEHVVMNFQKIIKS